MTNNVGHVAIIQDLVINIFICYTQFGIYILFLNYTRELQKQYQVALL